MTDLTDRLAIREAIERWAVWRDSGDFDRLATLWHPEGQMFATWFQASGADFVSRSRLAWATGVRVAHMIGGSSVDIIGDRAVSLTRTTLVQRGSIHDVEVDVVCYSRFWDAWQRINGAWLLRLRQPIYDMDHMIALRGSLLPELDQERLGRFPMGYRHLAYLQTELGFDVSLTMPDGRSDAAAALIASGEHYLAGDAIAV